MSEPGSSAAPKCAHFVDITAEGGMAMWLAWAQLCVPAIQGPSGYNEDIAGATDGDSGR
jgi:hypothetical protein